MNSRINAINASEAQGEVKELLNSVQKKFGAIPNIFRVAANSEVTLSSLLNFMGTLSTGNLDRSIAERIAILSAQENGCDYCLSAHVHIAKSVGLSESEINLSRDARSSDNKIESILIFARSIIRNNGRVSDSECNNLKQQGVSDSEILEIVTNVCLNIFTNYLNNSMKTEIDFSKVSTELAQSR